MDKLLEAIEKKKAEINELELIINSYEGQIKGLKESAVKYNDIKQKVAAMNKQKREMDKSLNLIINFIKGVDEKYLDKIFPLFRGTANG